MNCCTKENPCGYGEGDCDQNKGIADMMNAAWSKDIFFSDVKLALFNDICL